MLGLETIEQRTHTPIIIRKKKNSIRAAQAFDIHVTVIDVCAVDLQTAVSEA